MFSVNCTFLYIHNMIVCGILFVKATRQFNNMNYSIFLKFRKVFSENLLTENESML